MKTFFNLPTMLRCVNPRLALEPRVVFDAALVATGVEVLDGSVEAAKYVLATLPEPSIAPVNDVAKDVVKDVTQDASVLKNESENTLLPPAAPSRDIKSESSSSSLFELNSLEVNSLSISAAQAHAEKLILDFFKQPDLSNQLFKLFNGGQTEPSADWLQALAGLEKSILQGDYSVQVNFLRDDSMRSALGAFAAQGPHGNPVIYINLDWLQSGVDTRSQTRVLLEEFGHSLDARLNGKTDTPGDEGQVFAASLLHEDSRALGFATDDDHARLQLDGVAVDVEMASFTFVNAYEINVATTPAGKEANKHDFVFNGLGVASISDDAGSNLFSGNDVSAVGINIGGSTYFGWISRPIKVGGVVKGFYFWTDVNFVDLATARADGNADADGSSADNLGFILVVDQAYFDSVAFIAPTLKTVGSSSDRVDAALNSLYVINSPPTAVNDTATVLEDAVVLGNLLTNDSDANANFLTLTQFVVSGTTYTLAPGASQTAALAAGSLSISSTGAYSFTPTANYAGAVPVVNYTVSDGIDSSSASFSIRITPVNDAPAGADKTLGFNQNNSYTFSAADFGLTDALDNPANTLAAVKMTSLPVNGTLSLNGVAVRVNQTIALVDITKLQFSALAGASGAAYASFNFQVQDTGGTANGGVDLAPVANTITFNVVSVNSAPIAALDTATAVEAGGIANATVGSNPSANVLSNDSDPDAGDTKTVTFASSAVTSNTSVASNTAITGLFGMLTISSNGTYTYSVNNLNASVQALRNSANTLTDSFNYSMKDTAGLTSSSRLTVTITGANDNPQALNDFNIVTGTSSLLPTTPVSGNVLANDTDVDAYGETKTINATTAVAAGVVLVNQIVVGAVTDYDNPKNQINAGDLVYIYTGGTNPSIGETALQTTGVTVVSGAGVQNTAGGALLLSGSVSLTAGQILIFKTTNGSVSQSSASISSVTASASNTLNFTASNGTISNGMTVTGTDATGTAFSRLVTAVNLAAGSVSVDGAALALSSTSTGLNFSLSLSGTVTLAGRYGSLALTSTTGAYIYTPYGGLAVGLYSDTFNYVMQDAALASSSAALKVAVQVQPPSPPPPQPTRAPDAKADSNEATEAGVTTGINPTGNVITAYRFIGASPTLEATGVDSGAANLTVSAAWSGTTATETSVSTNTTITGQYGTLVINPAGAYAYALNNGNTSVNALRQSANTLTDTFFYRLSNADGTDVTTLSFTINGANDAPVAVADTAFATEAGGVGNAVPGYNPSGNVLANDTDVDAGDTKTVVSTAGETVGAARVGSYGSLILAADGSYTYNVDNANADVQALAQGQQLVESFTYTLSDEALATSTATLTITITGANDAPVNSLPGLSPTVAEGASTALSGISVADFDDANLSTQLSIGNGKLTIVDLSGTSISAGANGSSTLTLIGTQANINLALATLSYQGSDYFSGIDTLTVVSTDSAKLQAVSTLDINVTPDNRSLTVNSITVNEASAYAVFSVVGAPGQRVNLSLTQGTASSGLDFLPTLEYFNTAASTWLTYDGNPVTLAGSALLVRVAILNDQIYEGAESFTLVATNTAGTSANGAATIIDFGVGIKYTGTVTSGVPDTNSANLDDDRPLTITSVDVNEKSPYAVFTVTGTRGQSVALALTNGTASDSDHGVVIEYLVGSDWTSYTSPVRMTGTTLLVRTSITDDGITVDGITDDSIYEGRETFGITATNGSGVSVIGTGAIFDDGTGSVFVAGNTSGDANTAGALDYPASLDDDRVFSVSSPLANENSNYIVFTVTGDPGLSVTLSLSSEWVDASSLGKANINAAQTLQYWDGSLWTDYRSAFLPALLSDGKLLVRVNIQAEQDSVFEGPESFKLSVNLAPANNRAAVVGTGTITDDGTGVLFPNLDPVNGLVVTTNLAGTLDNDSPTGTDKTVTVIEDTAYTFASSDFGFADGPGDSNTLAAVKIVNLPSAGELRYAGLAITASQVAAGYAVSATDLASNQLTYLPAANANGANYSSFTFSVKDSSGALDLSPNTITVTVIATPANNAPVNSLPAAQTTAEDTVVSFSVTNANAITVADVDGGALTTTLSVLHGTLSATAFAGATVSNNGTAIVIISGTAAAINGALDGLRYSNTADYNGADTLRINTSDGSLSVRDTLSLTVTAVADIAADSLSTNKDTALTQAADGLLVNDSFENGAAVVTAVGNAVNGTVSLNAGNITFTPSTNFTGLASFDYTVTSSGTIETARVTVSVSSVNTAPVAVSDALAAIEDTPVIYTAAQLLGNDSDVDNNPLTIASVTSGAGGTAQLNSDGTVSFTPGANFNGSASFSYSVTDGALTSNTAAATVTVASVNDAPVNSLPAAQTTAEDTVVSFSVTNANASTVADVDGGALTTTLSVLHGTLSASAFTGATVSNNGTAIIIISGTAAAINGALDGLRYSNTADYNGTDTLRINTSDGSLSVRDTLSLTVTAVADIAADSLSTTKNTALTQAADGLLVNDSFGNGAAVVTAVGNAVNGTVSLNAGDITFIPDTNFTGLASFDYTVTSGGTSETASVTVSVNPIPSRENTPSVITGGSTGNGIEDTVITDTLLVSDLNGLLDGSVYTVGSAASHGTASIDAASGLWLYTPMADYNGTDSFTVSITDDAGNTSDQVISLTLSAVADIVADSLSTTQNKAVSANLLTGSNGASADNFEASPVLSSVSQGGHGSVSFDAAGLVTYTPLANFSGADSFSYTVTSGGTSETTTVTVNVSPVTQAPAPDIQTPPVRKSTPVIDLAGPFLKNDELMPHEYFLASDLPTQLPKISFEMDAALHVLSSVKNVRSEAGMRAYLGVFQTDSASLAEVTTAGGFEGSDELIQRGSSFQAPHALYVQNAVRHEALTPEPNLFVQNVVRASQVESQARQILVNSFNSATPAVFSLLDAFAVTAPSIANALDANQPERQLPPSLKLEKEDSAQDPAGQRGLVSATLKTAAVENAVVEPAPKRRAADAFSAQLQRTAASLSTRTTNPRN